MNYFYENRSRKKYDNIPLSIYYKTNFNYMAHWHTEFELAYVESGSVFVCINNDRRKLFEGDIAVCNIGNIHYYESTSEPSKIFILVFKPEFFGFPANWPDTKQFASHFFHKEELDDTGLDNIRTLLCSILEEEQTKKEYYELSIKAKVIELCVFMLRYLPAYNVDLKKPGKNFSKLKTMQEILIYIENNFTEDITLQALADKFYINSTNLSSAFNSVTGNNLKTHLNKLRISKAEKIIRHSSKPLIDVAIECGFNNLRTFNRAYKAIKGYIPSAIR